MARKRSQENTKAKQDFIAQLVKESASVTMNEAGKKVRAKFGTQLAYDKLRDAFSKAGGKIDTRRGPKKGSKRKTGAKKAKAEGKGSRKHIDRRMGRRESDQRAARINATLKGMPKHVVIVHNSGAVDTSEFASRDQAVTFARSRVLSGVSVSDIAYYTRQPLEISVGI